MGFGNGYDSGYSDAIDDVRNGKVPGIGPASGDGAATARTAGLFYITGGDEALEFAFNLPNALSGDDVSAAELPATVTTSAEGAPLARVEAPDGGWVPGDAIIFNHNNSSLAGIDRGDTVPDDAACSHLSAQNVDAMLMRLADTWTLFALGTFE